MNDQRTLRIGEVTLSPGMQHLAEMLATCMQCGTCTASCPVAHEMDYTPRQILHLIELGMEQEVLSSRAMWVCASCFHCTARCPRGIEIADVMAALRNQATAQGYKPDKAMTFSKAFMTVVNRYGRVFEPELIIRYGLGTNPLSLVGQAPFGISMFLKNKLTLRPDRMEDVREVRAIFDRTEKERSET